MRFRLPFQARFSHGFQSELFNFRRFYLKNRTTIKPTLKSLIFFGFSARRGSCFVF